MEANIAAPAALIGDPARAAMLQALFDGRAQPATALAWAAGVSAQSASNHLTQLVAGGLLNVTTQGRHRYYRLAGPQVAQVIEALAVLGPAPRALTRPLDARARSLRDARSCYDHIAGRLGVALADAMEHGGLIEPDGPDRYRLTEAGRARLAALGVDLSPPKAARRGQMRPCLDWTERRRHLAGPLAARLMTRLLDLGWLRRTGPTRALLLTPAGHRGLSDALGLDLSEASAAA
ncbi:MAG TPA: winged helix-turn-helix domain-containing protein [Caulobacteraceae bacterium]